MSDADSSLDDVIGASYIHASTWNSFFRIVALYRGCPFPLWWHLIVARCRVMMAEDDDGDDGVHLKLLATG